jgi:hypothetical protein
VNPDDFEAVANRLINEQTNYYKFPLYTDSPNGVHAAAAVAIGGTGTAHLDVSNASIQTASSCSVTPNSHYSNNNELVHNKPSSHNNFHYNMSNNTKLDIGSACGEFYFYLLHSIFYTRCCYITFLRTNQSKTYKDENQFTQFLIQI